MQVVHSLLSPQPLPEYGLPVGGNHVVININEVVERLQQAERVSATYFERLLYRVYVFFVKSIVCVLNSQDGLVTVPLVGMFLRAVRQ